MAQTVFDVGDPITSRLKLGVTPDGTTVVTVVVTKPDGSVQAGVAGPTQVGATDEYTAQWTADYAAGGDYLAKWSVTGVGAGVQAKVYNVRALPSAGLRPAWVPFLSDVADYVPRLTIDTVTPGSSIELGTFTGLTNPTDEQAQRLIDQAVASISAALPALHETLYDLAAYVVSLRAAAAILRAYARNPQDIAQANDLDRLATAELTRLVEANGSVLTPGGDTVPEWSFPDPVPWGDGLPGWNRETEPATYGRWGQDLL